MRLPDDDELYEVDQTYLGPPRRYIGEMRYRTIFLFLVIAPVTLVLLRKLGMPVTLLSIGLWLLASSYLSMKASDYISSESSAGAWLMTFWHELTTPRVETTAQYAGGVAVAFRHASRPRGGWAKAQRRSSHHASPQAATVTAPLRSLPSAAVASKKPAVQTPPVRSKAAPVRPVIEAKVVEGSLPPSVRGAQAEQQSPGGVRRGKGGWSSRPAPSPREPRDVPWKGGAPWQERNHSQQRSEPAEQAASQTEPDEPAEHVRPEKTEQSVRPEQVSESQTPPAPAPSAEPAAPAPPPPPAPRAAAAASAPRPAPTSPAAPPAAAEPAAPPPPPPPAEGARQPRPNPARQPLSPAVRPGVRIAPEPGLEETDDQRERPQSVDDYRKRLDGDDAPNDAPNDGGTA